MVDTATPAAVQNSEIHRARPDWLIHQLPGYLASDEGLRRFLRTFQDVADTLLDRSDHLHHYIDRTVAPDAHLHFLGRWVGLQIDRSWDERRKRHFLEVAGPLFRSKGTAQEIRCLLEGLTGARVEIDERGGVRTRHSPPRDTEAMASVVPHPMVTVRVGSVGDFTLASLTSLARLHLPADTNFEVVVDEDLASADLDDTCVYREESPYGH